MKFLADLDVWQALFFAFAWGLGGVAILHWSLQ